MDDNSSNKVEFYNENHRPVFTGFRNSTYTTFDYLRQNFNFLIMSLNCRSFLSKKDDLFYILENNNNISILSLCETWQFDVNTHLDNFEIHSNTRSGKKGGGLAVFCRDTLKSKAHPNLNISKPHIEALTISYTSENRNKILISIYRPPNPPHAENIRNFYSDLQIIINKVKNEFNDSDIEITGDFNLNLYHDSTKDRFINFTTLNSLNVGINRVTRESNSSATCIDNHLISEIDDSEFFIIPESKSDHWITIRALNIEVPEIINEVSHYRIFNDANKIKFIDYLISTNWNPILETNISNIKWNIFFHHLDDSFNKAFPKITKKQNSNKRKKSNFPWITDEIRQYIAKEKTLYHKKNRLKTNVSQEIHKQYKTWLKSLIRRSKNNYIRTYFKENFKNSKKIWQKLNELTGRENKVKAECSELKNEQGIITTDKIEIAEQFNKFFTKIGTNLSENINIDHNKQNQYFEDLKVKYENIPTFKFTPLTEQDLSEILKTLKPKKSSGPDDIPGTITKVCIATIPNIITNLINSSLETGQIHPRLKCANVITLHKKGAKNDTNNYRPISLLNSFSKILEKAVSFQLIKHLDANNILYKNQFGFRKKHSTVHAIIDFIHKLEELKNKNDKVACVFIDLMKAFDTTSHTIILKKLNLIGVKDEALNWFKNYLNNRKQRVKIGETFSDFLNINLGVPQGSILGPLLFSIYINDFPEINKLLAVLFADDTTIILNSPNNQLLKEHANSKLEASSEWFNNNELTLNALKTRVIHYNNKDPPELKIENTNIEIIHSKSNKESTFKFLGFNINEKMQTLDEHILKISKKLISANYALKNLKKTIGNREKRLLYFALFQSNMEYGISIYGNNSNACKKLFSLQKNAVCYIEGHKKVHSEPLFKKFNILKFTDLKFLNDVSIAHSVFYKYAPTVIQEDILRVTPHNVHDLRRNTLDLVVNGANENSITKFIIPSAWNSLPEDTRKIKKPHLFKNAVKRKLLSNYSNIYNCQRNSCYICNR